MTDLWTPEQISERFTLDQVRWLNFERVGQNYLVTRSDGTVVPGPKPFSISADNRLVRALLWLLHFIVYPTYKR